MKTWTVIITVLLETSAFAMGAAPQKPIPQNLDELVGSNYAFSKTVGSDGTLVNNRPGAAVIKDTVVAKSLNDATFTRYSFVPDASTLPSGWVAPVGTIYVDNQGQYFTDAMDTVGIHLGQFNEVMFDPKSWIQLKVLGNELSGGVFTFTLDANAVEIDQKDAEDIGVIQVPVIAVYTFKR